MADIIELIYEDHDWFRRHFFYLDDASTDEELAAVW
ncbi:MAG: cation-binding protein, partial [Jatrophihabitans sp.]|nr:cation-binding protein [Jatrophihabitans sp.]